MQIVFMGVFTYKPMNFYTQINTYINTPHLDFHDIFCQYVSCGRRYCFHIFIMGVMFLFRVVPL